MDKINRLLKEYAIKFDLRDTFDDIKRNQTFSPFSYEIDCLAFLLSNGYISFQEYQSIEQEYKENNKYLDLYDMGPRAFGETWGEQHILELFPEFKKETVENNPSFDGEYDLILDSIRVEVKACRANRQDKGSKSSLASRAYTHSEAQKCNFKYHFQQLKPSCCDIFIWIGVCKDDLIYWILTSDELKRTGKLGSQHRNINTGLDVDVFEGQVFMTEEDLKEFCVEEENVLEQVKLKAQKFAFCF